MGKPLTATSLGYENLFVLSWMPLCSLVNITGLRAQDWIYLTASQHKRGVCQVFQVPLQLVFPQLGK